MKPWLRREEEKKKQILFISDIPGGGLYPELQQELSAQYEIINANGVRQALAMFNEKPNQIAGIVITKNLMPEYDSLGYSDTRNGYLTGVTLAERFGKTAAHLPIIILDTPLPDYSAEFDERMNKMRADGRAVLSIDPELVGLSDQVKSISGFIKCSNVRALP